MSSLIGPDLAEIIHKKKCCIYNIFIGWHLIYNIKTLNFIDISVITT